MQRSGIHLGSIGGTTLRVEITFLILVALFVILDLERGEPLQRALLWIPILFFSVLLHELGHAAMIAFLGFGSSEILLAGFGGLTINRRASRPGQDILISLAGPFSSFLLALATIVTLRSVPFASTDPMLASLLPLLAWANMVWGVFNLVPIYPLDGGQAFNSLARMITSDRRAAVASIVLSLLLAAAAVLFGIYHRLFFLAIIAGMLLMQNYQRWQALRDAPPPDGGEG